MSVTAQRVTAVRRFNRFYTRQLGLLQARWLQSPFSLTESRVLYELAQRDRCTASDIVREMQIDHGYLSRILGRFLGTGLIRKVRSPEDGRQTLLSLTAKGRKAFAPLERRSVADVAAMLGHVPPAGQKRVIASMAAIERIVAGAEAAPPYTLRPHRPGDMGWIVSRHGALYAAEYGWNDQFESLVAGIASTFLKTFEPARECCWIAEIDGEPVGSGVVMKESAEVARLRLLIVEPHARGLGIGRRLVDECLAFARNAGYRSITLWTNGSLTAARAIYQTLGFRLVKQWPHSDYGQPDTSEIWELTL